MRIWFLIFLLYSSASSASGLDNKSGLESATITFTTVSQKEIRDALVSVYVIRRDGYLGAKREDVRTLDAVNSTQSIDLDVFPSDGSSLRDGGIRIDLSRCGDCRWSFRASLKLTFRDAPPRTIALPEVTLDRAVKDFTGAL